MRAIALRRAASVKAELHRLGVPESMAAVHDYGPTGQRPPDGGDCPRHLPAGIVIDLGK